MTGQFSRRDLLRAGVAGVTVATAGCSGRFGSGAEQWRYDAGFGAVGPPATGHDTVFIGGEDKAVHAIDAASGSRMWRYETGGSCARRLAIDESETQTDTGATAYVESEDATLYALRDGKARWQFETHVVADPPVLADGTVYLPDKVYVDGQDRGRLYALDARTGQRQWMFRTDREYLSLSTVAGDTVVCMDRQVDPDLDGRQSRLYTLEATDGTERWAVEMEGDVIAAARAGGVVAALVRRHEVSDEGRDIAADELRAFDIGSGARRWSRSAGTTGTEVLLVTDKSVYTGVDGAFVAYDIGTGEVRWRIEGFNGGGSDPVQIVDGTVYLPVRTDDENSGSVLAVAADDGSSRWERSVADVFGDPAEVGQVSVAGDTVYATNRWSPSTVVAMRPGTGERRATYSVENGATWTATQDAVYVGTDDGSVVSL